MSADTTIMTMYNVPPDTREKEKVVGGILNVNQLLWIIGGIVIGVLLFAMTYIPLKMAGFSVTLAILGILSSLPFVFYKKNDLTLYQILKFKREYKKKTKFLINKRKGVS